MRKLTSIVLMAAVALGLFGAFAGPVSATGNCSAGYVLFYKDGSYSGTPVKICWGVNDSDFTNLGPDVNGVSHSGWNNQLSSFKVRAPSGYGICLYRNENYSSLWHQSTTTEDWNIDIFNNDETGSFKWGPISPLNHRAAC